MPVQNVANNPLGSYPVLVDKNTANADIQVVRLDIGVGTAEQRLTGVTGLPTTNTTYTTNIDDSNAPLTYIGIALPGSDVADAVWQIKLLDETTSLIMTFADGDANFDNIWDDRASLIYL